MRTQLSYIVIMDIRLSILVSLPRVLLSPIPDPLETTPPPMSMPPLPKATYNSKEELYTSI
jgi:hypothetical protein